MLLRYFTILTLTLSSLFCVYDQPLFEEYSTVLRTVNKNRATIEDSPLIEVGSSGIVMRRFENSQETIIARAIVLAKDGISALVELKPYDALAQNTFPKLAIIPKSEDEIRLNYLYNRSLIVAPTYENYKAVTDYFTKIDWVHPDIPAAYLAKKYVPNPDLKDFGELCSINLTGLIAFSIENREYFVDCISHKIIKVSSGIKADDEQRLNVTPFYSRISANIQTSPLIIGDKRIKDYTSYYKKLLGIE
ncbi:MAG: plasminogen-binding N-terminal domain-containing protein [Campylobacteraceae bacterium]|nr:plasminogen-binding N-terminal domain-containing protein [Campylobacteraceae bacterium]